MWSHWEGYRKEIKITERNVEHKQYLLGLGLPEILANYISFAVDEITEGVAPYIPSHL